MVNYEERIFKFNDVILTCFDENSGIKGELIEENNKLAELVNEDLKNDYKKVLEGYTPQFPEKKEPEWETAAKYQQEGKTAHALCEYIRLLRQTPEDIQFIKCVSSVLLQWNLYDLVLKHYVPVLTKHSEEDTDVLVLLAYTYCKIPKYYKKAIPMLKKLYKIGKYDKYEYLTKLSELYISVYHDKKLDEQIKYAKEAADFNNMTKIHLAELYFHAGKMKEFEEYIGSLLKNNPENELIYLCSMLLIKSGRIKEGFDKYRIRHKVYKNSLYPKSLVWEKRWDGKKDISNSTVIVQHEQGFGDDIMFARYIPALSKMARKVIFVTQGRLLPLYKSSGYEKYCTLYTPYVNFACTPQLCIDNPLAIEIPSGSGLKKIPHDYHIPLFDLPYLMNESPSRMTESGGYLAADKEKIEEYGKKHIMKTDKVKIGLSWHGVNRKQTNERHRDLSVMKFIPLFKMKGVEFYSLQADKFMEELDDLPDNIKVYNLGKDFKDFEDTACAMSCMDLIITTDNVCLNLAGALGIRTYGLFNVFPEYRWYKTKGDDVGWYKSVRPFKARTWDDWDNLILEVKEYLLKEFPELKNYQ